MRNITLYSLSEVLRDLHKVTELFRWNFGSAFMKSVMSLMDIIFWGHIIISLATLISGKIVVVFVAIRLVFTITELNLTKLLV